MKIGIVTIVDDTNYGNRLQNYAVNRILRSRFGCDAVTLVGYQQSPFHNGNYIAWGKEQIAKQLCRFPSFAEKRFGTGITRWANFQKWSKRYIPTKKYYRCSTLPKTLNREYDYFFAGSDQIWNYRFSTNRTEDFFLAFADPRKRVSLSASFGVETIPLEWQQTYIAGLNGFSHISVREDAGQKIVKELTGREVPVLIDPVMMLSKEEWLKVAKKPRVDCSKPYVLKYYLGDEAEDNAIDIWAKENGYEVYELLNEQVPELYSAGPGEFLSLIQNASLVCSDSFHCIVFAMIFNKPFMVYERQGQEDYMMSRLETLLKKFHYQDRWQHLLSADQYLACDYTEFSHILIDEQTEFNKFLSSILT